jgi:hypothetical protein
VLDAAREEDEAVDTRKRWLMEIKLLTPRPHWLLLHPDTFDAVDVASQKLLLECWC